MDHVAAALRTAAQYTDRNPSEAQKASGVYRKGKFAWNGETIAIENPKGSIRSGTDKNGRRWECRLPAVYGYLLGTKAVDGDHVDCYVGDDHASNKVWVIDQVDLKTRAYDEPKCMLDFPSKDAAIMAYAKAFSDGKAKERIGSVTEMSVPEFRAWANSSAAKKPVGNLKGYAAGGAVSMPLVKGNSRDAISANIKTEKKAGAKQDQAVAIALNTARRYAKRASGGRVGYDNDGSAASPAARMMASFPDADAGAQNIMPQGLAHSLPGNALYRLLFGLSNMPREITQASGRDALGLPPAQPVGLDLGNRRPGYAPGGWIGEGDSPADLTRDILPPRPRSAGYEAVMDKARALNGRMASDPETAASILDYLRPNNPITEARDTAALYRDPDFKPMGAGEFATSQALPALATAALPVVGRHMPTIARYGLPALAGLAAPSLVATPAGSETLPERPKKYDGDKRSAPFVRQLQKQLQDAGFKVDADGSDGAATRNAEHEFNLKRWNEERETALKEQQTQAALETARAQSASANATTRKADEETAARVAGAAAETDRKGQLKKIEEETPAWRTALRTAAPYLGYGIGLYAGSKLGKSTAGKFAEVAQGETDAANALLKGKVTPKTLNKQIGNVNMFAQEGAEPARNAFTELPSAKTFPYWKPNAQAPSSSDLYLQPSRAGEHGLNLGKSAAIFGGEAAITSLMAHYAQQEVDDAYKAMEKDPNEANAGRWQRAQDKLAGWELASRVGTVGAPLAAVKGSYDIYTRPHMRPDVNKYDEKRADIAASLAGQKRTATAAKERAAAKATKPEAKPDKAKAAPPNGAGHSSALLPLATLPALSSLDMSEGPSRSASSEASLPSSSYDADHASGGTVNKTSRHHSHYQPRDEMNRFAGGPVYESKQGSQGHKPRTERAMGGGVEAALATARKYAHGGAVRVGPMTGATGGRDDKLPISVPSGSYIVPADAVSGMPGAGNNTAAGFKILERMFGRSQPRTAAANGGPVGIKISDGEYILGPDQVAKIGGGSLEKGHSVLDAMVHKVRADHVKTLSTLPSPSR